MSSWFDTHSHLNDEDFADDQMDVIARMREAGVDRTVVVGYDAPSSERAAALTKHPGIYAAAGIHPHDAQTYSPEIEALLRRLLAEEKVVALGEVGLDYYYDYSPRQIQQEVFRQQIRLAKAIGKPLIIHEREAVADTLQILREERAEAVGGVMHCFSGSLETAKILLDMGFYIGVDGPVTFKNARKLPEVVPNLPADRIVLETDCPYLTPVPHRGERNEPAYIPLIGETVAKMRGWTVEETARRTTENAERLFGLSSR